MVNKTWLKVMDEQDKAYKLNLINYLVLYIFILC